MIGGNWRGRGYPKEGTHMVIITGLTYDVVDTLYLDGDYRARVTSFNLDGYREPGHTLGTDCVQEYHIRGRRIHTPDGREVILGNIPNVEEFLGIQFDLFDNMKKTIESTRSELFKAQAKVNELEFRVHDWALRWQETKDMGFFGRLKFLFTGRLE